MKGYSQQSDVLRSLTFGIKSKPSIENIKLPLSSKVGDTLNKKDQLASPVVVQAKKGDVAATRALPGSVNKSAESDTSKSMGKKRKKRKNKMKQHGDDDATTPKQPKAISHEDVIKQLRREHHIHVYGPDLIDPVTNFKTMFDTYKIDREMLSSITKVFCYEAPTAIQMQVIPFLCERRQVLACAPTGSGKTASFLIPVIHHCSINRSETRSTTASTNDATANVEPNVATILKPRAIVLAPTAELASQIYRVGMLLTENLPNVKFLLFDPTAKSIVDRCDVLICTPNRLVYSLSSQSESEPKNTNKNQLRVDLSAVEWLVVDECDKLFEDGTRGFRDQLARLFQACTSPSIRYALFSATYAYELETWCKSQLDNLVCVYVGAINAAVTNVKQELKFVGDEFGKLLALRELLSHHFEPPALVFVQSRERAAELLRALLSCSAHEAGLRGHVDVLHAAMTNEQRTASLQRLRTGVTWLLVCTDVAARGLDIRHVRLVVNYDMPTSEIVYIHRIGRTGRAGMPGHAVTLFTEDDRSLLNNVARVMKRAGFEVPAFALKLSRLRGKKKKEASRRPPERDAVGKPRSERAVKAKQRRDKLVQRHARDAKKAAADERKAQRKLKKRAANPSAQIE